MFGSKSNNSQTEVDHTVTETSSEPVEQPVKKSVPDFVAKSDRVTTPAAEDDELAFFEKLASE